MSNATLKRAVKNYRRRLSQRGMARFEVLASEADRYLIRSLAKRLAASGPDAARIREAVRRSVADTTTRRGGVLAALRRSPLVGADLDLSRPVPASRKVDL